jgi:uncharacterized repeat protein (TIGR03803 family)
MRKTTLIRAVAIAAILDLRAAIAKGTPVLTTLVTFNGLGNGSDPFSSLVADSAGNLYGTTGQNNYGSAIADGTVFELPATNYSAITTLSTFNNSNGSRPQGNLAIDSAGDVFGTTDLGGGALDGTVFAVYAGSGAITDLASFNSSGGGNPVGGVVLDKTANLYGTTSTGGGSGGGSVFRIPSTAGGSAAILTRFPGGSTPEGKVVVDSAGDIFGTTSGVGTSGNGTVFEIPASTGIATTIATFNGSNGGAPNDLTADTAGNLYGTTKNGGASGYGTVFEIPATNPGEIVTLATFNGSNGGNPNTGVLIDANGDLFGTTPFGGSSNIFGDPTGNGTVYEVVTGSNAITDLAAFNGSNGSAPEAALTADSAGNLYGTTEMGGNNSDGTVFEITSSGFVVSGPQPIIVASGQTYNFQASTGTGITQTKITGLTIQSSGIAIVDAANHANRQLLIITGIGLSIAGNNGAWTGKLDLTNNDMDLTTGSLATVTNQIRQGCANGTWNGSGGITSSSAATDTRHLTALGVIQNNQGGSAIYSASNPFDGYAAGASDILVKYTYYGDANLDGKVDGTDYSRIDNGYLTQSTGWFNGDFNYDGVINGSDYTLIDNAFNTQGSQLAAEVAEPTAVVTAQLAEGPSAVPEPTVALVMTLATAALLTRRRRMTRCFVADSLA